MDLISRYRQYLEAQQLSAVSVKNYLSDINKFLDWFDKRSDLASLQGRTLNEKIFQLYYRYLEDQSRSESSLQRYRSSLRQFGQFLVSCGETTRNPADALISSSQNAGKTNLLEVDKLLAGFEKALTKEKLSKTTILNYLVDIRQFLGWLAATEQPPLNYD